VSQVKTPTTLQEVVIYFSDKDRAFEFFTNMRWPNNSQKCPCCGSSRIGFIKSRQKWQCKEKGCRKQFTIKTGTIMEDSPLGLDKWAIAMWLVCNAKNGISSYEVGRSLGITQKSAWFLMHRIRLAMTTGTFEKFSGEVEADETYIGQKAENMHADKKAEKIQGRGASGKTIVLGALQRGAEGTSKVTAKVISNNDRETLKKEIEATVEKGSTLYTDGHSGYDSLNADYVRLVIDHAIKYVDGKISTNGIENFWTLLKRALKGTYVSVEPFHLFRYLDEQSFRFNYRKGSDEERFLAAMREMAERRVTYEELTGKV
jgi:transposase-like protein